MLDIEDFDPDELSIVEIEDLKEEFIDIFDSVLDISEDDFIPEDLFYRSDEILDIFDYLESGYD